MIDLIKKHKLQIYETCKYGQSERKIQEVNTLVESD